jgi:hypothetical protein
MIGPNGFHVAQLNIALPKAPATPPRSAPSTTIA